MWIYSFEQIIVMSAFVIKESVICIVECTKAKRNLVCKNKCSHWLILRVISDPSGCFILHCWRQNRIKVKLCLVGGVEKWEDEKLVGGWKIGRIEKFWFFLMSVWLKGWKGGRWKIFLFGLREKWEDGKCSLYELTIMWRDGKVKCG